MVWRGAARRSARRCETRRGEARRGVRQAEGSEDQTSCDRVKALRLTNTCLSGPGASRSLSFVRHLHGAQYHSISIQKPFGGSQHKTPLHSSPRATTLACPSKSLVEASLQNFRVMLDATGHFESDVGVCSSLTATQDPRFAVETSIAVGVSGRRILAIIRRADIEAVGLLGSRGTSRASASSLSNRSSRLALQDHRHTHRLAKAARVAVCSTVAKRLSSPSASTASSPLRNKISPHGHIRLRRN